jgi:hypothetical protein
MPRKRRRLEDGLHPPNGTVANPSAVQVVRLVAPPCPTPVVRDSRPPGLLDAIADPLVALVLLHGPLAEDDPSATMKRWVGDEFEPVLVDGTAISAPRQCRRVWRLAGLVKFGGTAPMLPVMVEMPPLLVTEMTVQLEAQVHRRWDDSLLAVVSCSNVYDGDELRRLRQNPRVKVCYMPAVDLGRAYSLIARELGIDAAGADRLRSGALAAAAGNVTALRASLAFSARGAKDGEVAGRDHTIDKLDAAAGHLLGHHAGPAPDPTYIHAVAPQCCRSLEQLSMICDGLATVDLIDRSCRPAMQRTLVSAVTKRARSAAPPVHERRKLNDTFYRFLKKTYTNPAEEEPWRDLADRARGALGQALGHWGLRKVAPVSAAICLGAVAHATAPCELSEMPPWTTVSAVAPDPITMLDRARVGRCEFEGTAWAMAWTQLAAVRPLITSVQLEKALKTAQAVGVGLLSAPPPLFAAAAAVEAAAATLLTDYRVVAYKR